MLLEELSKLESPRTQPDRCVICFDALVFQLTAIIAGLQSARTA
jgi:hypothetical protein